MPAIQGSAEAGLLFPTGHAPICSLAGSVAQHQPFYTQFLSLSSMEKQHDAGMGLSVGSVSHSLSPSQPQFTHGPNRPVVTSASQRGRMHRMSEAL